MDDFGKGSGGLGGDARPVVEIVRFDNAVAFGVGFCFPTSTYISEMDARVKGDLGILSWVVVMVVGGGAGRPMRVQRRLSL
jgi:hypothetical protein